MIRLVAITATGIALVLIWTIGPWVYGVTGNAILAGVVAFAPAFLVLRRAAKIANRLEGL